MRNLAGLVEAKNCSNINFIFETLEKKFLQILAKIIIYSVTSLFFSISLIKVIGQIPIRI